jgi:EAL domain-containing protein (putative c-di-GMP-specific phosphodiesterase class I)
MTANPGQSILRAIESLAYSLGMYVVAEGIETEEENEYINAHTNIVCGQGYLFYKPQFIDELIEQIETSRALAAKSILKAGVSDTAACPARLRLV